MGIMSCRDAAHAVVGRLGDVELPADVGDRQPLGQVAVDLAEQSRDLVGGPSLLHGSLLGTLYRGTPISGGPILGGQATALTRPTVPHSFSIRIAERTRPGRGSVPRSG